jgi:hypothetical protein
LMMLVVRTMPSFEETNLKRKSSTTTNSIDMSYSTLPFCVTHSYRILPHQSSFKNDVKLNLRK